MSAIKEQDNALRDLLGQDFDFQGQATATITHGIHAFAAKFPPQLPAVFIERLTAPGDVVLDPMMGSGTTLVESAIRGRKAIGLDLDPLSIKQCKAKTTPIDDVELLNRLSAGIVASAYDVLATPELEAELSNRFDKATKDFVDYWFTDRTQRELEALLRSIELATDTIEDERQRQTIREFFEVALSAIIVTKSGGVTKARDLAHGRAHIYPGKTVKDAINQFRLRVRRNIASLEALPWIEYHDLVVKMGDARNMRDSVPDGSIDLVVTSPPYANAIDYMRAHKFEEIASLVWTVYQRIVRTSIQIRWFGANWRMERSGWPARRRATDDRQSRQCLSQTSAGVSQVSRGDAMRLVRDRQGSEAQPICRYCRWPFYYEGTSHTHRGTSGLDS